MNGESSDGEDKTTAWLASLPRKVVAAKVIIRSDDGNVLLVKPNYKKGWQFPGGGVEASEDPKLAATRELKEELGLSVAAESLQLMDIVFDAARDNLIIVYELRDIQDESTALVIQQEELDEFKYVPAKQVAELVSDYYHDFCIHYLTS